MYNNFFNIRQTDSMIVKIFVMAAALTALLLKSLLQIRH